MPREFLMAVQESAYKTPVTTPIVWTTALSYGTETALYLRLDEGNAFTMRPRPVVKTVPYGGGLAVPAYTVSDKQEVKGKLKTVLTAGTAPMLLNWASARINAGQTAPWTTTEPAGDLASCSIYHAIQRSDGTYKRRVYLGCKVGSWSITTSSDSTDVVLDLDIVGSTPQGNQFDSSADPTATVFPAPADDNMSVDPYLFIHLGGGPTIGTARPQIESLEVHCQNHLASSFFAGRYLGLCRFVGRQTTSAVKLLYAPTPDDRTSYEGLTAQTVSVELSNGTRTATLALNGQNVFGPLEDDLPLDGLYLQSSTLTNQWDATAGADFTWSFS